MKRRKIIHSLRIENLADRRCTAAIEPLSKADYQARNYYFIHLGMPMFYGVINLIEKSFVTGEY
jgi:hypothetical protein